MADGSSAPAARGKLRRVALADVALCPNERPRRANAMTWGQALEDTRAGVPFSTTPFDVSDIASTLTIDDGCALFLEAPAVRPIGPDTEQIRAFNAGEATSIASAEYELIFGERRMWAALLAGCTHASVKVYDVGAEEAALMHYRENACRVDLPPLADAAELARLRALPMTDEQIATRTGRTLGHVRRRLALLRAIEPVRDAVAAERCTIEAALLFAAHEPEEQERVWANASDHASRLGEIVSAKIVRFMFASRSLKLVGAPWPLDANVGPRPCTGCPGRSDAQADLFGEAPPDAICLVPSCWETKGAAWSTHVVTRAKERGIEVLGEEASRARGIFVTFTGRVVPESGLVDLDGESPILDAARKPLTWRMVLPSSAVPSLVATDASGGARELVSVEEAIAETKTHIATERERAKSKSIVGEVYSNLLLDGAEEQLDGWAAAIAASRPEIREPTPAPLPKATKPGKASDRAKAEAKADVEGQIATLANVAGMAALDGVSLDMLAGWAVRIVSDDAVALVADRRGSNGTPRPALLAYLAETDDAGCALLAEVLAAELLVRGGEGAELPARWAGVHPAACTCGKAPGSRGRHRKGCQRTAKEGPCVTCGVTFKPGEHRREADTGGHEHAACPPAGEPPAAPTPESPPAVEEAQEGAAERGAEPATVESRIEACRKALALVCRDKGRKEAGALAALKSRFPESTPAERRAAVMACLDDGQLVDDDGRLVWAGS